MTHYEERLEHDLTAIRSRVSELVERVDAALAQALKALLTGDLELANDVILGDLVVNRRVRKLDAKCHAFVARHLPSAGHLRFVSSVLRLSIALERVGDYAVIIARELAQLETPPPQQVADDLELNGQQTRQMFRQAGQAFVEGNAALADGTRGMGQAVKVSLRKLSRDLMQAGEGRSVNDVFALAGVVNSLRRVADQAENVCEETAFVATGAVPQKRLSSILFTANRDDSLTQLAVAYARKAYAAENHFESAGWTPVEGVDPACRRFMEKRGLDSRDLKPTTLEELGPAVLDYEVIVSLDPDPKRHIAHDLPFQTVVLEWDVGKVAPELEGEEAERAYEEVFDRLKGEIGRLMEIVRGREVD